MQSLTSPSSIFPNRSFTVVCGFPAPTGATETVPVRPARVGLGNRKCCFSWKALGSFHVTVWSKQPPPQHIHKEGAEEEKTHTHTASWSRLSYGQTTCFCFVFDQTSKTITKLHGGSGLYRKELVGTISNFFNPSPLQPHTGSQLRPL